MTRALVIPEREIDRVLAFLEEGAFDAAQSLVNAMIQLCPSVDRALAVAAPELLEACEVAVKLHIRFIENLEQWLDPDDIIECMGDEPGMYVIEDAILKAKGG